MAEDDHPREHKVGGRVEVRLGLRLRLRLRVRVRVRVRVRLELGATAPKKASKPTRYAGWAAHRPRAAACACGSGHMGEIRARYRRDVGEI